MSAPAILSDPSRQIVATVYVYPAPSLVSIGSPPNVVTSAKDRLCQGEFDKRKSEIMQSHPDATLLEEQDIAFPRGTNEYRGKKASYTFSSQFQGRYIPLSSQLYVFCYIGGKWAFEYRFSSPREVASAEAISAFMKDLPWTISGVQ